MKKNLLCALNLALLPLYLMVGLLAFVLTWVPVFPVRIGLGNLRTYHGAGLLRAHVMLARVFMHYVYYAVEMLVIWSLHLQVMDEEEELHDFLKELVDKYGLGPERGFIMLGAHYGNIEICGQALSRIFGRLGKSYFVLAKPSKSKIVNAMIEWYRSYRKLPVMLTNRSDLHRTLHASATSGVSLALLVDQKPKRGGVFVRFLGEYAAFPIHGAGVGVKTSLPIVHINAQRIRPGHFRLVFGEGNNSHLPAYRAKGPSVGNIPVRLCEVWKEEISEKELEVADIFSGYVGWLENIIAESPTQWFWDYRKWSRQPKEISR